MLKINQDWSHPALDRVMVAFSSLEFWTPFLVLLAVVALWRGSCRVRLFLVVLGLTIAVADGLVARTLKHAVNRPRPHQTESGLVTRELHREGIPQLALFKPVRTRISKPSDKPVEGRSFPSAHTVNMFAAATATFVVFRGWWWLLYVPAAVVAYSRVYTGSHWPSDIPPSVAMGVLLGWLVPVLANRAWKSRSERFRGSCPDLLRKPA